MNNYFTNTQGSVALAEEKVLMMNGYQKQENRKAQVIPMLQANEAPQFIKERAVEHKMMERRDLDRCYREAIELSSYKKYKEKQEVQLKVEEVPETIGKRVLTASKKWVVNFINA